MTRTGTSFGQVYGVPLDTKVDCRFDGYFSLTCSICSSSYLHQTWSWCGGPAESLWRCVGDHSCTYMSSIMLPPPPKQKKKH